MVEQLLSAVCPIILRGAVYITGWWLQRATNFILLQTDFKMRDLSCFCVKKFLNLLNGECCSGSCEFFSIMFIQCWNNVTIVCSYFIIYSTFNALATKLFKNIYSMLKCIHSYQGNSLPFISLTSMETVVFYRMWVQVSYSSDYCCGRSNLWWMNNRPALQVAKLQGHSVSMQHRSLIISIWEILWVNRISYLCL